MRYYPNYRLVRLLSTSKPFVGVYRSSVRTIWSTYLRRYKRVSRNGIIQCYVSVVLHALRPGSIGPYHSITYSTVVLGIVILWYIFNLFLAKIDCITVSHALSAHRASVEQATPFPELQPTWWQDAAKRMESVLNPFLAAPNGDDDDPFQRIAVISLEEDDGDDIDFEEVQFLVSCFRIMTGNESGALLYDLNGRFTSPNSCMKTILTGHTGCLLTHSTHWFTSFIRRSLVM